MSRLWAALLLGLVTSSSSSSIPNTDSCWARNDGICDDGVEGSGPWANACPSPCGTDLSDCGIRYEHECRLPPPPSPAPPSPSPVNYWEASPDENNSNGEGTTVIILIVVGVLVAIVAVAIVGCIVSLKCFAIFVLVLSIITLLITIVSVPASFFLALPAAAVSTVAFVLACIGSSIVVCGCRQGQRRQPRRPHFMWRAVLALVHLPPRCARGAPHFLPPPPLFVIPCRELLRHHCLSANDRADRCYGARRACTRHPVHYMGVRQRGSRSSSWCSRSSGVNDGTERHSASAGRASGRHGSELTSSCRLCSCSRSRPRSLGITEIHMQWRPMHSADRTTWWGGRE